MYYNRCNWHFKKKILNLSKRPTKVDSLSPLSIWIWRQIHASKSCRLCLAWDHEQCTSYVTWTPVQTSSMHLSVRQSVFGQNCRTIQKIRKKKNIRGLVEKDRVMDPFFCLLVNTCQQKRIGYDARSYSLAGTPTIRLANDWYEKNNVLTKHAQPVGSILSVV